MSWEVFIYKKLYVTPLQFFTTGLLSPVWKSIEQIIRGKAVSKGTQKHFEINKEINSIIQK